MQQCSAPDSKNISLDWQVLWKNRTLWIDVTDLLVNPRASLSNLNNGSVSLNKFNLIMKRVTIVTNLRISNGQIFSFISVSSQLEAIRFLYRSTPDSRSCHGLWFWIFTGYFCVHFVFLSPMSVKLLTLLYSKSVLNKQHEKFSTIMNILNFQNICNVKIGVFKSV